MERKNNYSEPDENQLSNISLRQLNEERLKGLDKRFEEEPPASNGSTPVFEQEASTFQNYQASGPDANPNPASPGAAQNIQRKFSTSWVKMQNYLGDKRQNRDWDAKFK